MTPPFPIEDNDDDERGNFGSASQQQKNINDVSPRTASTANLEDVLANSVHGMLLTPFDGIEVISLTILNLRRR